MDAVILFSHGSLLCGSGGALLAHAARLREQSEFAVIEIGYLNYSEPPFIEAVRRCVAQGASRILVAPYFLVPGKFVTTDLPKAINEAKRAFPELKIVVAHAIGYDEELADAILDSAVHAVSDVHWRDDLNGASLQCRNIPTCPLYETTICPHQAALVTATTR